MPNETTYASFEAASILADVTNEHILAALYDFNHVQQFTRRVDLAGVKSRSHDVGLWPRLTSASVSEGIDLATTQVVSKKVTVTAAEQGIMVEPTDVLFLSSVVGMSDFAQAAAQAVAEKQMSDVANLATGFSATVGTSGADMTESNIIDAIATLANNRQTGQLRGLVYPQQWLDYLKSVGSVFTPASGPGRQSAREATADFALSPTGFQRDMFGVEWFVSTAVPTANAGADSAGVLLNPARAIARGVKYESRTEFQRNASKRATEIVVTAFDGVVEIEDGAGVGIVTDR